MAKGREREVGRGRSRKRWGRMADVTQVEDEDDSEGEVSRTSMNGNPMPKMDPWETKEDTYFYHQADF